MSVAVVQLRSKLRDADVAAMAGARLRREQLTMVTSHGDVDVFKPDGKPLVRVRRRAVPAAIGANVMPVLSHVARSYPSSNRGAYAGLPRAQRQFADGTRSTQAHTMDEHGKRIDVESAVIGFFDRSGGRYPFCRATRFTAQETAKWEQVVPLVHAAASAYKAIAPERYALQMQAMSDVHEAWRITGTPFTTLTVNDNVLGSIHTDKGDYKEGMGVISVHRRGTYTGAILGFPQFGVGVEMFDRDLLLFDSHAWHGVTEFEQREADAERISVVYYMRRRMTDCGSPEQELQRAREYKEDLSALEDDA